MMRVAMPMTLLSVASGQQLRPWELRTRDGELVDEEMLSKPVHDDEMINAINSDPTSTWKAGRNMIFEGATLKQAKVRMGTLENTDTSSFLPYKPPATIMDLPEEFDWRTDERAENCPSLREIRDQSNCGSCWAFGTTEAMTDRICITSKGTDQTHLSAQDVTSCAKGGTADVGCGGGVPETVYTYYWRTGIVTGGNYGDKSMCYSYQLEPCAHHSVSPKYANCSKSGATPTCANTCTDDQTITWAEDKRYGMRGYSVCSKDASCPEAMRQEIYQNGPITGQFFVHRSFLAYKSGVYSSGQQRPDPMMGGHAIKIMGWGNEDGNPYWLVANSWNEEWGDEGFFKIMRNTNEDQIENAVFNGGPTAGMPATAQFELV